MFHIMYSFRFQGPGIYLQSFSDLRDATIVQRTFRLPSFENFRTAWLWISTIKHRQRMSFHLEPQQEVCTTNSINLGASVISVQIILSKFLVQGFSELLNTGDEHSKRQWQDSLRHAKTCQRHSRMTLSKFTCRRRKTHRTGHKIFEKDYFKEKVYKLDTTMYMVIAQQELSNRSLQTPSAVGACRNLSELCTRDSELSFRFKACQSCWTVKTSTTRGNGEIA